MSHRFNIASLRFTLAAGLLTLACAVALPGCDQASSAGGTIVGVIDLDAVATATGQAATLEQQLRQRVQAATEQARADLEQLQAQANTELRNLADQFGANPTADQQRQLQNIRQRAQASAQRKQLELNQQQQAIANELKEQFRTDIRPTLNEVARSRGASIVLVLNDNVAVYDTSLDLTQDLIAALKTPQP